MKNLARGFLRGLVEEIFMRSAYGRKLGSDTLVRWIISIALCVSFYFLVYFYDEQAIKYDQWLHEVFGWKLSAVPAPGKIAWHRIAAGGMASIGALFATVDFGVNLYRRIKLRMAVSKSGE